MSVGDDELESLINKRINVHYFDGSTGVEILHERQGTLLAVITGKAILVRFPGEDKPQSIETKFIQLIEAAKTDRTKKVVQKILVHPILANINAHLADKHNYLLSVVNDVPPVMAMRLHDRIEHDDLGHSHNSVASLSAIVES